MESIAVNEISQYSHSSQVRIILKDMRLGLGETTLLTTLHPDAKDYFEVNADLGKLYFGGLSVAGFWISLSSFH